LDVVEFTEVCSAIGINAAVFLAELLSVATKQNTWGKFD